MEEGYEVALVAGGRAALREIEQEPPDLILLDMILPDLDGFALLAELYERGWSFPILAMTASSSAYERARRLLGFRHCLPKPLDEARLLARIRLLLAEEAVP